MFSSPPLADMTDKPKGISKQIGFQTHSCDDGWLPDRSVPTNTTGVRTEAGHDDNHRSLEKYVLCTPSVLNSLVYVYTKI